MKLLILSITFLLATQQTCSFDNQCNSCCNITSQTCMNCYCNASFDCGSKCCIKGKCLNEKYCKSCSSHEECDYKCCVQGNCNEEGLCPYYPAGMACAYNYQCASYQCFANVCTDIVSNSCANHTDCLTNCCYNGSCSLKISTICPALQINSTCSHNWDCDTYLCKNKRCQAFLTGICYSHEDCDSGCCINSRCATLVKCLMKSAGSACVENYECTSNRCLHLKCISRIGEVCFNHSECEYKCCLSGVCGFGCKYFKNGIPCSNHFDCLSYICKSGLCVGDTGSYCAHHSQCKSGFCKDYECSTDIYKQKNLVPGDACFNDYECQNYLCYNEYCHVLTGASCRVHSDCSSDCCIDFKCGELSIAYCNKKGTGSQCNYNWECHSGICSFHYCLGLVNMSVNGLDHENCSSMCSANSTCINYSSCTHKNAGEICSSNSECMTKLCNQVCLGAIDDICVSHYNCIIDNKAAVFCQNHVCRTQYQENLECIVNEDCFYGYQDSKFYNFTCFNGNCISLIGNYQHNYNCISGCNNNDVCEQYSYCAHEDLELCNSHMECSSKCCSLDVEHSISQCSASNNCKSYLNTNDCASEYECASFYCNSSTHKCDTKPCIYHQECIEGCCNNGYCTNVCNLLPALSTCESNYQCAGNKCLLGICKLDVWSPCFAFDECISGCCSNGVCKINSTENCPFKNSFNSCNKDYECKSYICNPNLKKCSSLEGEGCFTHEDCSTGCCGNNSVCYIFLDPNNCKLFVINHECNYNYECLSFACYNGYCKGNINDICGNHEECLTKYCNENSVCAESIGNLLQGGYECASNYQCESYTCINHTCRALNQFACTFNRDCFSLCCNKNDSKCLANENNEVCLNLPLGSECTSENDCESGLCDDKICKESIGGYCKSHSQCESGFCKKSDNKCQASPCPVTGKCLLDLGEYCYNHSSCSSGCCNGECMTTSKCYNLVTGSSCLANYVCKSYNCTNYKCDGEASIKYCYNHAECNLNCCDNDSFCGYAQCSPKYKKGEQCSLNYECNSYICIKNKCSSNIAPGCKLGLILMIILWAL